MVGGGLGDIAEVLAAGRRLVAAGATAVLYRRVGRPLPAGVDGPWEWPAHLRRTRIVPSASAALTVAPAWGVSAASPGPGPLRRPGPWTDEAADVERAYGPERTLHVSLEEFARTLTSRAETRERFREGGVRHRALRRSVSRAHRRGEVAEFGAAFRRFRAFDRPNLLHLFAGFAPSRRFRAEFPEAIETGPLWPGRPARRSPPRRRRREWVWYASPASAEALLPEVAAGLRAADPPVRLYVRTPRAWPTTPAGPAVTIRTAPLSPSRWNERFAQAEVRIVTGSRTLLEALELGGPFLYFNGVMGRGPGRRRHRPEKIVALLRLARAARWPADVRRDLADFARGRRVRAVVGRVVAHTGGWGRRWPALRPRGFRPPFDDAGEVLVAAARSMVAPRARASEVVAELRRRSKA